MKSLILLFVCSCVALACGSDATVSRAQSDSTVQPVSVCDELRPDLTKQVRIRGIYRVGFEWAELYSIKCTNAPRIWVNFSDDWTAHTQKGVAKQLIKGEGTYGVTFVGTLGGRGGHMGAFPLTLRVTSVDDATRLGNESVLPHALSSKVRRRVESFEGSH